MSKPPFKRGDTYDWSGQLTVIDNGAYVEDLTGWEGVSQIRTRQGRLVAALEFTWIDASQRLCRIRSLDDTSGWPIGEVLTDIKVIKPDGSKGSTSTTIIDVLFDPTRLSE